jgi:hypothetical protein
MTDEATNRKDDKAKSEGSGPMGSGMFEIMKKCCAGEGAFSDCAAMMKNKMGAATSMPCCGADRGKTEPDRRKK